MPARTEFTTEQQIKSALLPQWGKSYTVIPHSYVIDQTRDQLDNAGFKIDSELYKSNLVGTVAQGIYHLDYANDPDMGLMFAWSNSYNKTMSFKCAVGARVFICMNGVVSGDLANYKRRHSGSALMDVTSSIAYQISQAKEHYDKLIMDKEMLKQVSLSRKDQASIVGQLFLEHEILTSSQVNVVKQEMNKPSFNYNASDNSAWALYNHITLSLKDSHPTSYLTDHQKVHTFFVDQFGNLNTSAFDNNEDVEIMQVPELTLAEEETGMFGVSFM